MTDLLDARREAAGEWVANFKTLSRRVQDQMTYEIAERLSAKLAKPANIIAFATGIRLAVAGEPMPEKPSTHQRKGYAAGESIRDGLLRP